MPYLSREKDFSLFSMKHSRIATIALSGAGVLFNMTIVTSQLAFIWQNFSSEQVLEREDLQRYMVETGVAFGAFFLLYFLASAGVCLAAFIAALEHSPGRLKAAKQTCFIDASFWVAGLLAFCLFAGLHLLEIRTFVCEVLSHQPAVMRAIDGLMLRSCESWAEREIVSLVIFMALVTIVKVQYLLTISLYYYQLLRLRSQNPFHLELMSKTSGQPHVNTATRIYLLPSRRSTTSDLVVYIPLNLNAGDARQTNIPEVWMSSPDSPTIDTLQVCGRVHLSIRTEGELFPREKELKHQGDMEALL